MTAIDEVRAYWRELEEEGCIRTDLPPRVEEEFYNPIECAPRGRIEEFRDKHLRHIVNWAYNHSEFYHRMWDEAGVKPEDIKGYDDLEKLPVWRKEQQREDEAKNPPFGSRAVKELIPHIPRLFRSTGTTGESTMQLWLAEDFEAYVEAMCRHLYSGGCRAGGAWVDFFPQDKGSLVPAVAAACTKNMGLLNYGEGIQGYFSDPEASLRFQLKLGQFYKPLCTLMTPEFLGGLGQRFKAIGEEAPYNVVLPGGMPLTPRGSAKLQTLFKKARKCINIMSSNEGDVTYGCPVAAEQGLEHLHESEDLFVFEVVKPGTGERVARGERGELILTTFSNHVAPFVRFSLEDVFENSFTTEPCGCGRTNKRWLKLCPGRLKDIFKVRGKELLPWDVELIIESIPDTTMIYQLVIDSWDMERLKIKVETTRKLPDPSYEKEVKATLEEGLGFPVEVEVVSAGTILPPTGGYKVTKVIDNRPKRD